MKARLAWWILLSLVGAVSSTSQMGFGQESARVQRNEALGLKGVIRGQVVQGTLVDSEGRPVTKDVALILQGEYTHSDATLDNQGRFRFEGVVDEATTLTIFAGSGGFYRTGSDSPDLLLKRQVSSRENQLALKVNLRPAKP